MELKDRIVKESFTLFALNGIKSVTMDEIARTVGISKRTLYESFGDKEALVLACVVEMEQCRSSERDAFLATSPNIMDLFFIFLEHVHSDMKDFNRNFVRDMKRYHPKVYEMQGVYKEQHTREMVEVIRRGQQDGIVRLDINVEISVRLMESQVENYWFSDKLEIRKFNLVDYFEQMILIYLRGISTTRGLEMIEEYCAKRMK